MKDQLKTYLIGSRDPYVVEEIDTMNMNNLHILAMVIIILETIMLGVLLATRPEELDVSGSMINTVATILGALACYVVSGIYQKQKKKSHLMATVSIIVSLVFMCYTGWTADYANFAQGRQIMMFYVVVFCYVSFITFRPVVGLPLFLALFVGFYKLLLNYNGAAGLVFFNYVIFAIVAATATIIIYHVNMRAVEAKRKSEDLMMHLSDMSFHDALTGLLNRHALDEKLNPSDAQTYCVAMCDINAFKSFNDTYGHQTGDFVLQETAARLLRHFRKTDCYRYGGDEYLIISENIGREIFFRRIYEWKQEVRHIEIPGVDVQISVSCGIAIGKASDKDDLFELIRQADDALYKEKTGARDTRNDEEEIVRDVYEAMESGEIVAFYQPKIDIRDNHIIGAEALVRWKRNGEIVPPFSFLPILEDTGDIREVDFFIFNEVCKELIKLEQEGLRHLTISCNFSQKHFVNDNFVHELIETAESYGVDKSHIEIEITETFNHDDMKRVFEIIRELRQAGFRTALDDFGSGYSSLSMIKDIPMDVIKLDKSLLSTFGDFTRLADKDMALVKDIVSLIKDMQMMCLAEGVETLKQKEFLESIGCNYVQGFLYDRPLELEEFEQRVREGYQDLGTSDDETESEEEITDTIDVNVLLAEDNEINQEITRNLLEDYGATVVAAMDGQEALTMFETSEVGYFDVILMDIQMPVMDGYESTSRIRALDRPDAADIPIIAITVDIYRETKERAEAAGMTDYVTKPLDPDRLLSVLKELKRS